MAPSATKTVMTVKNMNNDFTSAHLFPIEKERFHGETDDADAHHHPQQVAHQHLDRSAIHHTKLYNMKRALKRARGGGATGEGFKGGSNGKSSSSAQARHRVEGEVRRIAIMKRTRSRSMAHSLDLR